MILCNPFLFQSKLAAQEIFELRKANEMEYHEQRMTNLAELHSAQMEVVALEKEYFQKRIALLNSMYTSFCKFYGKIGTESSRDTHILVPRQIMYLEFYV